MSNDLNKYLEKEKFKKRKPKNKADDLPPSEAEKKRDKELFPDDVLAGMRRFNRGGKV